MENIFCSLIGATFLVFLINIPFGYWRSGKPKFSLHWFLAIHLPVPLVIAIRHLMDLGFQWYTYPFLVAAFFSGQYYGKRLREKNIIKPLRPNTK